MLQYSTVEPRTLDLLKKLMQIGELKDFYLLEGTALSLYYGHRMSVDLDIPVVEDGIRLVGIRDIMAMKIAAILKRGVKKDFWDIAELLHHYSIEDFINCYNQKYPNHQLLISIPQALTYFADADESEDPVSLKGQTWDEVKKKIQQAVNAYLK